MQQPFLYYYCSISCFLTKILPCAFLSREAPADRRNRQIMDFKLPHVVVCACAKRDEPPSRRMPSRFPLDQNNILSTNSPERWPTSARHSVSSMYSVDCPRFVFIRVHSWLIINVLVAANSRSRSIPVFPSTQKRILFTNCITESHHDFL